MFWIASDLRLASSAWLRFSQNLLPSSLRMPVLPLLRVLWTDTSQESCRIIRFQLFEDQDTGPAFNSWKVFATVLSQSNLSSWIWLFGWEAGHIVSCGFALSFVGRSRVNMELSCCYEQCYLRPSFTTWNLHLVDSHKFSAAQHDAYLNI